MNKTESRGPPVDDVTGAAGARPERALVLVRGIGDVASAVAHRLSLDGLPVALHQGAEAPLTHRRRMGFADAWFDGEAELAGLRGCRLGCLSSLAPMLREQRTIPVITAEFGETLDALRVDVLIDARMRKRDRPADQRGLAPLVVGLGPGFVAGGNVDWAVETAWGDSLGLVIREGSPLPLSGEPQPIGNVGRERVVYASRGGRWCIRKDIGDTVAADEIVADLDGVSVMAPISGTVRGIVRDGVSVGAGTKVLEIDPHPLMEMHGGTLALDSIDGEGTTVRARFPAERIVRPQSTVERPPQRHSSFLSPGHCSYEDRSLST